VGPFNSCVVNNDTGVPTSNAALWVAATSSTVGSAQAPDKFTLGCTLSFDAISVHWALDTLEQATAGSAHPFRFGKHELVPEDRSAIRADDCHQTSDGPEVHERTLVRTVAFLDGSEILKHER